MFLLRSNRRRARKRKARSRNTKIMTEKNKNIEITTEPQEASGMLQFRRPMIVLAHILMFVISLMMAFLFVNNMQLDSEWFFVQYLKLLLCFLVVKIAVFGFFKQYQGWWRYVGISDLMLIVKASLVSTLILVVSWFGLLSTEPLRKYLLEFTTFSQAVFILDMFATIVLMGGLRMAVRLYHEEFQ